MVDPHIPEQLMRDAHALFDKEVREGLVRHIVNGMHQERHDGAGLKMPSTEQQFAAHLQTHAAEPLREAAEALDKAAECILKPKPESRTYHARLAKQAAVKAWQAAQALVGDGGS